MFGLRSAEVEWLPAGFRRMRGSRVFGGVERAELDIVQDALPTDVGQTSWPLVSCGRARVYGYRCPGYVAG